MKKLNDYLLSGYVVVVFMLKNSQSELFSSMLGLSHVNVSCRV